MTERRFSFDAVADLYDAARPGYPDALFEHLIKAAGARSGASVLEVGCGTGKATEGFLQRGLKVLAVEPGAQLIAAAKRRTGGSGDAVFVQSTFEAFEPTPDQLFPLIAAAQAWHWVAPEIGFAKAADLLRPGGTLAVFGNVPVGVPPALEASLATIYNRHAPDLAGHPGEGWYLPQGPVPALFAASGRFEPAMHLVYSWDQSMTAAQFAGFLASRSSVLVLDQPVREALLNEVVEVVEAFGGAFDLAYQTHLHHARRD